VSTLARRYAWMAAAMALLFALWILRSFLVPMAWAFMIALATWPLYRSSWRDSPRRSE
jgi:predicted PurR-regulated permease PerM